MELESGNMDGMKGNGTLPRMDKQERPKRMRRERWRRLDWTQIPLTQLDLYLSSVLSSDTRFTSPFSLLDPRSSPTLTSDSE
jgi:hypothetical protein